ncbi:MAG: hypothetical protein Phog2KO_50730 [Phototrophicaceae bacterium]
MVYKIYISANDDNTEYLTAMQRALFSINELALSAVSAEDIPILGDNRLNTAKMMIRESEVFIGLYDADYGTVPKGEISSHEELEYQFATQLNKSILIFVMENAIETTNERQKAFLEHVMKRNVMTTYSDAEDLVAKVKIALDNYHQTKPHRRALRPPVQTFRDTLPSIQQSQEATDDFDTKVERALSLASDDIEQIIRRALELHDAQHDMQAKPSEEYDNKITVSPLWGEPLRRTQFQSDVFMIMPFRDKYNAIFENVILPVTADLNLTIKRGDEFSSTRGSIMQEVWAALNACKLVIVETTEINANVYYELGIAHTLGKPAILLSQTKEVEALPFDIRHLRFLVYDDTVEGGKDLEKNLRNSIIWLLNDIDEQQP